MHKLCTYMDVHCVPLPHPIFNFVPTQVCTTLAHVQTGLICSTDMASLSLCHFSHWLTTS